MRAKGGGRLGSERELRGLPGRRNTVSKRMEA